MKPSEKFILILVFTIFSFLKQGFSENLQATFQYAVFKSIEKGPYVETYLTIRGNTAKFIMNNNKKYQSFIEITYIFKQDGEIISFSKNIINSPEINDSTDAKPNFIDQQRFSLPNGIYNMELTIKDINATGEFSFNDIITVEIKSNDICFGGVQFVDKYSETKEENILSKNGYDIVPYIANFFPENMNTLIFYTELYNIKSVIEPDQNFLLRYYIQNANNKKTIEQYNRIKKQKAKDINVVFSKLDISGLPSGNYNLVIEIKDKNNKILKQKTVFFQRSNPLKDYHIEDIGSININEVFTKKYTNIDTLKDYLKSVRPIADDVEKRFIDNQAQATGLEYLQQYFYSFWAKRNNIHPEQEWKYYKTQVDLVNKLYSSRILKGYETDRGRVYLQYGAPNSISESKHEPSAYPYEIWHYYQIGENETKQVNVRFVFYNPNIAGNDYSLLHSNARGEIIDKNWERRLSKRNNTMYNHDAKNSREQFGGRALELYNE